jgi:hypothetical protein
MKHDFTMCRIASFISVGLAVCILGLGLIIFSMSSTGHYISFTRDFHLCYWHGHNADIGGRLAVFNDADYGPYSGSIISLSNGDRGADAHDPQMIGFGDCLGIYYRYFRWPDRKALWTLMLSPLYPLIFFCLLILVWIFCRRRLRRERLGTEPKSILQ